MKRDIYSQLEQWKGSHRRKPLIVNGARQVGKTYALKDFGKTSYAKMAYVNFEKDEKACQYFETTLDPKQLIKILTLHTSVEIDADTLLIFYEIQECPKALNSIQTQELKSDLFFTARIFNKLLPVYNVDVLNVEGMACADTTLLAVIALRIKDDSSSHTAPSGQWLPILHGIAAKCTGTFFQASLCTNCLAFPKHFSILVRKAPQTVINDLCSSFSLAHTHYYLHQMCLPAQPKDQ
jgi:hypothetical protein